MKGMVRFGAGLLAPAGERARLSILIYHRVLPAPDPLLPWEWDAQLFEQHLRLLSEYFSPLTLTEAVQRLRRNALPARAVCVTFDDGYADNHEVALPILRRYAMPATFFVTTGTLDGGCLWNDQLIEALRLVPGPRLDLTALGLGSHDVGDLRARREALTRILLRVKHRPPPERADLVGAVCELAGLERAPSLMMTSKQVRELHEAGMVIGGHTVTHPILSRLAPQAARKEICDGKDHLEALLGERVTLFAYPNGRPGQDYTAEHVKQVRAAGFEGACSTAWGAGGARADVHQLPRFTPWDRHPFRFALRLMSNLARGPEDRVVC